MTDRDAHYGEVTSVVRVAPRIVRVEFGGAGLDGYVHPDFSDAYLSLCLQW